MERQMQPNQNQSQNVNQMPIGARRQYPGNYGGYVYNPNQNYANQANQANFSPQQLRQMEVSAVSQRIPKRQGSPFGLEFRPLDVSFATQDSDEKVFVLIRRHWVTNLDWIFRNLFYGLIPFVIIPFLTFFDVGLEVSVQLQLLFTIVFYSLVFTNLIREFLDWYYDIYIVTNDRIVSYEFTPFTSYNVKEAMLTNVEQVKEDSAGLFAGLFNYGNVNVSTASEEGSFQINKIPNPTVLRDVVSDLSEIAKRYSNK